MAKYVTKKRVIVVAVAALAIGLGTSAFAYFTSTGSGSGTATVGSSSAVELTSASVGPWYQGGAQVPVDVTIHNPGGGSEYVNHVSGSVAHERRLRRQLVPGRRLRLRRHPDYRSERHRADARPDAQPEPEPGRLPGAVDDRQLVEQLATSRAGGLARSGPPSCRWRPAETDHEAEDQARGRRCLRSWLRLPRRWPFRVALSPVLLRRARKR